MAPGVEIETGKLGIYREINTARDAAELLLFNWPIDHGPALSKPRLACLAAPEGKAAAEQAKEAFFEAAEEADLFVRRH